MRCVLRYAVTLLRCTFSSCVYEGVFTASSCLIRAVCRHHAWESGHGHHARSDDVAHDRAGTDGGELVNIAHQDQTSVIGYGSHQRVHEGHIDHRTLIDNHRLCLERVVSISPESPLCRCEFQKSVNGSCITTGCLRQSLGCPARRRAEQNAQPGALEQIDNVSGHRRFSRAGPAGQNHGLGLVHHP